MSDVQERPRPIFLSRPELADRWSVSVGTLANWTVKGWGPPVVKLRSVVRYRLSDVEAFEDAHMSGGAA